MRADQYYALSQTNEEKYRKKEVWQTPLEIFLAKDETFHAAFKAWQEAHPHNFNGMEHWTWDSEEGKMALAAAKDRYKGHIAQALSEHKVLSPEVERSIRYRELEGIEELLKDKVTVSSEPAYGDWRHGFDKEGLMGTRAGLLFGGRKRNMAVDGHVLLMGKKAADAILNPLIEKARLSAQAVKEAKAHAFPDISQLWPDMAKTTPLYVIGTALVPTEEGFVIVYLSDGQFVSGVDANKLALLRRYFPNAEMRATDYGKVVVFVQNGKKVGMMMPLAIDEAHLPVPIYEAAVRLRGGVAATSGSLMGANKPEKPKKAKPVQRPKPLEKQAGLSTMVKRYEEDWGNLDIGIVAGETEQQWEQRVKQKATEKAVASILEGYRNLEEAEQEYLAAPLDQVRYTAPGYEFSQRMLGEAIKWTRDQAKKNPALSKAQEPWQTTRREVMNRVETPGGQYTDSNGVTWEFTGKHDTVGLAYDYEMKNLKTGVMGHDTLRNIFADHERAIQAALLKAKPVPQDVLKDYPKLEELRDKQEQAASGHEIVEEAHRHAQEAEAETEQWNADLKQYQTLMGQSSKEWELAQEENRKHTDEGAFKRHVNEAYRLADEAGVYLKKLPDAMRERIKSEALLSMSKGYIEALTGRRATPVLTTDRSPAKPSDTLDDALIRYIAKETEGMTPEEIVAFYVQKLILKNQGALQSLIDTYHLPPADFLKMNAKIRELAAAQKKAPEAGLAKRPTPEQAMKNYGKALAFEAKRSPASRVRDEARANVRLIPQGELTSKRLKSWKRRPGRSDVAGVDSPRKPRLSR
jgi:hypothetical protein